MIFVPVMNAAALLISIAVTEIMSIEHSDPKRFTCEFLREENCGFATACSQKTVKILRKCKKLLAVGHVAHECKPECQKEIAEFLHSSNVDVSVISNCNCGRDTKCTIFKRRLEYCYRNKTKLDRIGCEEVHAKCKNSTHCHKNYQKWFKQCDRMINGYECSQKCLIREKKLYRNKIGKHLQKCECNGFYEEEKFCHEVRQHRKSLCKYLALSPTYNSTSTPFSNYQNLALRISTQQEKLTSSKMILRKMVQTDKLTHRNSSSILSVQYIVKMLSLVIALLRVASS